jgi:hypothetical protein
MSKITLIQEFDSYEERSEFKIASQAFDCHSALSDVMEMLRKYDKYCSPFKSVEEALEKIREEAYEIIQSHNITLE